MNLTELVRGYLSAQGYEVDEKNKGLFLLKRYGDLGGIDTACLWILTRDARRNRNPEIIEEEFLERFRGGRSKYSSAQLFLLVDTIEGLSNNFRERARRDFGVQVRVPVQYFDMPFKYEKSKESSSSAISRLNEASKEFRRVPQAYERIGDDYVGEDIVNDLFDDICNTNDARVWFIIGPAGQGKTVCFRSLFTKLHDRFIEHKNRLEMCPRPLPMIAEHIQEAAGRNAAGLLDAFLRTEIARPVNRPVFEWLIDNRHGIWMMDGLDEVVSHDPEFFPTIYERITTPSSSPAILISIRDSVFQSSEELSDFLEDSSSLVRVFRLKGWERPAKRLLAWHNLEKKTPGKRENDTPQVNKFLELVERNERIRSISSLPFYCDILLKAFKENSSLIFDNEFALLDHAVHNMCAREYEKGGALKEDIVPSDTFVEWLEELALDIYERVGVSADELKEMASLLPALVKNRISEKEIESVINQIIMAPFLTQSPTSERLEFTHEIIADYLTARNLHKIFKSYNNTGRFMGYLSKQPLAPDSILLKYLASVLVDDPIKLCRLVSGSISPIGLRNLVQLLAFMPGGDAIFRNKEVVLDGMRLAGVNFSGLNLTGVSFRGCDLTDTDFSGAKICEAHFEGTLLKNTRFCEIKSEAMQKADFGNLERFQSIRPSNTKNIEDPAEMREWLRENTGCDQPSVGPCPTAQQVLHLFRKFVQQDGNPRRDEIDMRGARNGKHFSQAPDPDKCIEMAIQFGYFEKYDFKGRYEKIKRTRDQKYSEVIEYVKKATMSSGIGRLLSALCKIPNCKHIPQ